MVKKKPTDNNINTKKIEDMLKALEAAGIPWQQTTVPNKQKNPPVFIPTVWTVPPKQPGFPYSPVSEDWEKRMEDQQTVAFMQECRERTADMKDDEKCARCKLRFRCYTEIKVEKKRKTKTRKPRKLGTQPVKRINTVLYSQSITPPIMDGNTDFDWMKVIKDVAENTRPDTEKEV